MSFERVWKVMLVLALCLVAWAIYLNGQKQRFSVHTEGQNASIRFAFDKQTGEMYVSDGTFYWRQIVYPIGKEYRRMPFGTGTVSPHDDMKDSGEER